MEENELQMEFMRKSRFDSLKSQFKTISPQAEINIKEAKPDDVLSLTLEFNSPNLSVMEAEIIDEDKFVELAF